MSLDFDRDTTVLIVTALNAHLGDVLATGDDGRDDPKEEDGYRFHDLIGFVPEKQKARGRAPDPPRANQPGQVMR